MIFVYSWFGIGLFVAAMTFIQWIFDGRPVHAERNDGSGEKWNDYYYLKSMISNVVAQFLLAPIIFGIQLVTGISVFPHRRK